MCAAEKWGVGGRRWSLLIPSRALDRIIDIGIVPNFD